MKRSLFSIFYKQFTETSKKVCNEVYDCLYNWLDDDKVESTSEYVYPQNERPQATRPQPSLSPPPEGLVGVTGHTGTTGTGCPEPGPTDKPSIMRGYLCTSFDDGESLGMALVAIAIDESHARKIMSKELQKYRLRLEPHDKLVEIDLHTPSVTLAMSDDLVDNLGSWPDYPGW